MGNGKIGIGPSGPTAGLIQFVVFAVVGIVVFVLYAIPVELIILKIIPATLLMLVALGCLALLVTIFRWLHRGDSGGLRTSRATWRG